MMIFSRSWPFCNKFKNGKMVIHKIPWKVFKILPKNGYMQLTKWVYEDLWVQEVKVILRPLNQDSHILTILSTSSKVTEPIITKFHIELPFIHNTCMFQRSMSRSHAKYDKKSFKIFILEPIERWSWYSVCIIQYLKYCKDCSNDYLGLTVTFLTARSSMGKC